MVEATTCPATIYMVLRWMAASMVVMPSVCPAIGSRAENGT